MPAAPTTATATATRIQTTRSHKPLSGQVKIPQIFAANQLASKNLTPSCRASPFPVPRARFTLSPFDIWPKPSHPPCRIAFLSPFFAVYFWHPLVWFGLVAAKTESAAIYFIATLASAATTAASASADVAATATAAARLVQVDSSTWRGLHAQ